MTSKKEGSALSASQKFLLAGHLTTALGFLFISVGTTLRLLENGELPVGQPFTPQSEKTQGVDRTHGNARAYFS